MKKLLLLTIVIASVITAHAQGGELMIKKSEKGLYLEHTVAAKEGLYAIGRLYNVNPKFIAAYNKIDLNQAISIGQVLQIPLTDTNFTQKRASGTPVYYQVGAGEGLLKVSNENNKVALKSLREWNSLTGDNVQAGSNLVVGFLSSKEMTAHRANTAAIKKAEPPVKKPVEDKPLVKSEPVAATKQVVMEEKKKENPPQPISAVVKEEVKPVVS